MPGGKSNHRLLATVFAAVLITMRPVSADDESVLLRATSVGIQYEVRPVFDASIDRIIEEIRDEIRRKRDEGKIIAFVSTPISGAGGGYQPLNQEVAQHIKEKLYKRFGRDALRVIAPGQPLRTGEEAIRIPTQEGLSPGSCEYQYLWTQVLAGDDGLGGDFDMIYFAGPSDFHDFLGVDGRGVLNQLNRYVEDRSRVDSSFREAIGNDPDKRRAFIRYYATRASSAFSSGSHDEWNLIVQINRVRPPVDQIAVYFEGRAASPAEMNTMATPGYGMQSPHEEPASGSSEPPALKELVRAIRHGDFQLTLEAVESLQSAGGATAERAVRALSELLSDESLVVRVQSAYAIGLMQSDATSAIPALVSSLQDESPFVRQQAAHSLINIGSEAVPALVEALDDADFGVQEYALYALAQLGPESNESVVKLAQVLQTGDKLVRTRAAWAFRTIDPSTAIPVLTNALDDREAMVRCAAVSVIGEFDDEASGSFERIKTMLEDEDEAVARAASEALVRIDRDASIPILIASLDAVEASQREIAATALGQIGPAAKDSVEQLAQKIKDEDEDVVRAAAASLKQIDSVATVAILSHALNHAHPTTRVVAASVLGEIGVDARAAVPQIGNKLVDQSETVFFAALAALKQIEPSAVVPALVEAMKHETPEIRRRAIASLEAIGPEAKAAQSQLKVALEDSHPFVKIEAAFALWKFNADSELVVPVLIQVLKDPDSHSMMLTNRLWTDPRSHAARLLGRMGKKATAAVEALTQAMRVGEQGVFNAAVSALRRIDEEALHATLIELIKERDPRTFRLAAVALRRISDGGEAAARALAEAIEGDDAEIRQEAILTAYRFRDQAALVIPSLIKVAENGDKDSRIAVIRALSSFGKDAKDAVPMLRKLLDDEDPIIRIIAHESLEVIAPEAARDGSDEP